MAWPAELRAEFGRVLGELKGNLEMRDMFDMVTWGQTGGLCNGYLLDLPHLHTAIFPKLLMSEFCSQASSEVYRRPSSRPAKRGEHRPSPLLCRPGIVSPIAQISHFDFPLSRRAKKPVDIPPLLFTNYSVL